MIFQHGRRVLYSVGHPVWLFELVIGELVIGELVIGELVVCELVVCELGYVSWFYLHF